MSRVKTFVPGEIASFPRVSGDEPRAQLEKQAQAKFSPRERG